MNHEIPAIDDPLTVTIRAALNCRKTGICVQEGPPLGPECPQCRIPWTCCECPSEVLR